MTVISITRSAKCKDCVYLNADYKEKRTRFFCTNHRSSWYGQRIRQNDVVCSKWKIERPKDVRRKFHGISLEKKWKERNESESYSGNKSGGKFMQTIIQYRG